MTKEISGLILASASPRRRALMAAAGYRYRVMPSHVSEKAPRRLSPRLLVQHLALKKALAVARQHPSAVVLGADTVVYINKRIVGKPRNPKHAEQILKQLSGAWQKVYTGVAVVSQGGHKRRVAHAVSSVKMRRLNPVEIQSASRRHLDKAGGYAVQQAKDAFVEKIRGPYDNVVGLPMSVVKKLLSPFGGKSFLKPIRRDNDL